MQKGDDAVNFLSDGWGGYPPSHVPWTTPTLRSYDERYYDQWWSLNQRLLYRQIRRLCANRAVVTAHFRAAYLAQVGHEPPRRFTNRWDRQGTLMCDNAHLEILDAAIDFHCLETEEQA